MPDDLATRLAAMQNALDDAPVITNENAYPDPLDNIEDDDYQALINGWEVRDDYENHPGVVSLKTLVQIQHHPVHGGVDLEIFMWDILSPNRLPFLKTHFYNLGETNLDLTQVQNGSAMFERLLDVPVLIGIYTSKSINQKTGKPYRNIVIRRRLDGGDLGTGDEQIAGFDGEGLVETQVSEKAKAATKGKPAACVCPDPANGKFDDNCTVPGHGIPF